MIPNAEQHFMHMADHVVVVIAGRLGERASGDLAKQFAWKREAVGRL